MTNDSVEALCKQREALEASVYKQQCALYKDQGTLEGIKTLILLHCKHDWQLDYKQELAPFDRRDSICTKCQSRNIAPGK